MRKSSYFWGLQLLASNNTQPVLSYKLEQDFILFNYQGVFKSVYDMLTHCDKKLQFHNDLFVMSSMIIRPPTINLCLPGQGVFKVRLFDFVNDREKDLDLSECLSFPQDLKRRWACLIFHSNKFAFNIVILYALAEIVHGEKNLLPPQISWFEAQRLCHRMDSFLPLLTSREDFKQFQVALRTFKTMQAFYIGLHRSDQVSQSGLSLPT